jgi:predicted oxidoreductase (fatty acid repression mutant protein)
MLNAPGCDFPQKRMHRRYVVRELARLGVWSTGDRLVAVGTECSCVVERIVRSTEDIITGANSDATQVVNLVHGATTDIVDAVQQTTTDIVGVPCHATKQRHQDSTNAACRASACVECVVIVSHRDGL